jgi:hypothetical protein
MKDDDIPVSDTDQLTVEGGPRTDRTRHLGEFSPTNSPLSAAEIEQRRTLLEKKHSEDRGWTARTPENIDETVPTEP